MKLRTLIFWPHLIAGVTAGLVILLMSVTGVLLTYERQMVAWADGGFRSSPPAADAPRLPVETLLATVQAERPGLAVTAVTVAADATAPVSLAVAQGTVFADAYSGRILGDGTQGMRRFMTATKAWHRWLAAEGDGRAFARGITGWSNLLFLFIVTSGLYLWLPRTWSWPRVRTGIFFKRGLSGKARDFNWHNAIGLWSAIPLFIVVASAVPMSFPWANALVYTAVGDTVPAGGGREGGARGGGGGEGGARAGGARQAEGGRRDGGARAGADSARSDAARSDTAPPRGDGDGGARAEGGRRGTGGEGRRAQAATAALEGASLALAAAERAVPGWQTINLRLPASADAPLVFAVDRGNGGQPQLRSTLTLDRRTGAVIDSQGFSDQTPGRRLRSAMRFAHTGEILGLPGQTIAGVASAGAVVLVWTGLALSLRRLRAWLARRRQTATAPSRDLSSSAA